MNGIEVAYFLCLCVAMAAIVIMMRDILSIHQGGTGVLVKKEEL
jgi:hypothetical protein